MTRNTTLQAAASILIMLAGLANPAHAEWHVLRQDATGVTATWTTGYVTLDTVSATTRGGSRQTETVRVRLEDAVTGGETGSPALPSLGMYVALPPGTRAQASASAGNYHVISGILAPVPEVEAGKDGFGYQTTYVMNPASYSGPVDPPLVITSDPQTVRDIDLVRLHVAPVHYDAEADEISIARTITVRVNFIGTPALGGTRPVMLPSYWKSTVLNFDDAETWTLPGARSLSRLAAGEDTGTSPFSSGSWLRIMITEPAIYRLTGSEIAESDSRFHNAPIDRLTMMMGTGEELPTTPLTNPPYEWTAISPIISDIDGDGILDGNDEILFYGTGPSRWKQQRSGDLTTKYALNRYTTENVYWLGLLDASGKPASTLFRTSGSSSGDTPAARGGVFDGTPSRDDLPVIDSYQRRLREEDDVRNFDEEYKTAETPDGPLGGLDWEWQQIESGGDLNISVTLTNVADSTVWFSVGELGWATDCDFLRVDLETIDKQPILSSREGYRWRQTYQTKVSPATTVTLPVRLVNINSPNVNSPYNCDHNPGYDRLRISLDFYEVEYRARLKVPANAKSFHFTVLPTREVGAQDTVLAHIQGLDRSHHRLFDVTDGGLTEIVLPKDTLGYTEVQLPRDGIIEREFLVVEDQNWSTPSRLVPAQQLVDLRARTAGVDYIVVTHPDFLKDAQRLAEMRQEVDGFRTLVATTSDVFDQYSYGLFDPAAIRNFLKDAAQNWRDGDTDPGLQYVVLMGDGQFNYRNINRTKSTLADPHYDNWMPTYQEGSLTTDDWFGVFSGGYLPSIQIGRLAVRSADEARVAVDKIIAYEESTTRGPWQNRIILASDDEFNADSGVTNELFLEDTEKLLPTVRDETVTVKVYQAEYPFNSQGLKPAASAALIDAWNNGSMILNYIGHGSPRLWSHERLFTLDTQLSLLKNRSRLPVVVALTCSAGHFDHPETQAAAEELVVAANGGAIASVAAARLVYSDDNLEFDSAFLRSVFRSDDRAPRLGDAYWTSKMQMLADPSDTDLTANTRKFVLIGDPALNLALPELPVTISLDADTLEALSPVTISGEVLTPDSTTLTSFDGSALVQLFDSDTKVQYIKGDGKLITYEQNGLPLFRGLADVNAGKFSVSGILPREVVYGGTDAHVVVQVWNDQIDGSGGLEGVAISRTAGSGEEDAEGPQVVFSTADEDDDYSIVTPIEDGAEIARGTPLRIWLSDPSGINVTGSIGHRLTVSIDGEESTIDITDDFVHRGSATTGYADVDLLDDISVQSIAVRAWDNANNSSADSIVVRLGDPEDVRLSNVIAHPNPMTNDETTFTWITEGLGDDLADATVRIYTVAGRLVDEVTLSDISDGPVLIPWEPRRSLANGVYLYQITVRRRSDGKSTRVIERLAVLGT